MYRSRCLALLLGSLTVSHFASAATPDDTDPFKPRTYIVPLDERVQYRLQERLINAVPGDVIQLEAGTYKLTSVLNVTCDNITVRGKGPGETILSFAGQDVGGEGIVATGDAFVIEDLAVEDSVGNAIKVLGANGVIFRRVRTEWTNGPSPDNGAYGIYPVQCENVLIEDCVASGASDAGIYVGQSQNVIVRRCRATQNVAGIEIENTVHADVYENEATDNTGGLLVFDLPGLQLKNGSDVRVHHNTIHDNNLANFAPPGNIVATVPAGTGVMVMATDNVEVFNNTIRNHQTTNVSVVSYLITERPINDPQYDPFPEGVFIHDNTIAGGGEKPSGPFGEMMAPLVGVPFPDIFTDGVFNPAKLKGGTLPDELSLKIDRNGDVTFANVNLPQLDRTTGAANVQRSLEPYRGKLAAIKPVNLEPLPKPESNGNPAVAVYRRAPRSLSGWGLFHGSGATQEPVDGVQGYELNTPLFSDYTTKSRFIRLPEGTAMTYQEQGVFNFPTGTVIAKTFAYPHDMTDPDSGERLLETRIQQKNDDGWYGFSYLWNDAQTEATLTLGGGAVDVEWVHSDGTARSHRYQIPNANQCLSCHSRSDLFKPIGPTAANLNRSSHFSAGVNQLAAWSDSGRLKGAPAPGEAPQWARWDDPSTGTLDERARIWLDVNCAHCHNPVGTARTSGLDLQASQQTPAKFGVWKSPVATGRGSGGRKFDIVPGQPDESILLYRLESDEPGIRMPSLSRSLTHAASAQLVRAWIAAMPPETGEPGDGEPGEDE